MTSGGVGFALAVLSSRCWAAQVSTNPLSVRFGRRLSDRFAEQRRTALGRICVVRGSLSSANCGHRASRSIAAIDRSVLVNCGRLTRAMGAPAHGGTRRRGKRDRGAIQADSQELSKSTIDVGCHPGDSRVGPLNLPPCSYTPRPILATRKQLWTSSKFHYRHHPTPRRLARRRSFASSVKSSSGRCR